MRKFFLLCTLAFVLCLSLCGCGKSEAVKQVEAMIDGLDTVTADSGDAIFAIEDAFAALSEEEQGKVKNHKAFLRAQESYYELTLAGTWYPCDLNLTALENHFAPRFYLELNPDLTMVSKSDFRGTSKGYWDITDGNTLLMEVDYMETETSSSVPGEDDKFHYTVIRKDGKLFLDCSFISYAKEADYFELLKDAVLAVDCSRADLNDYLGFRTAFETETDEWGHPTGNTYDRLTFESKVFADGWVFMGTSQDFALEVTYPAHTETYTFRDGGINDNDVEAGSYTVLAFPFSHYSHSKSLGWSTPDYDYTTNLTLDDFAFGRGKGYLYFLNSSYIKEIRPSEEASREIVLDTEGDHLFVMQEVLWQGGYLGEEYLDY